MGASTTNSCRGPSPGHWLMSVVALALRLVPVLGGGASHFAAPPAAPSPLLLACLHPAEPSMWKKIGSSPAGVNEVVVTLTTTGISSSVRRLLNIYFSMIHFPGLPTLLT